MYLINFLEYLGVTLPLMVVAVFLFIKTTPYAEFVLMAAGDELENPRKVAAAKAAALDLGGKVIGLALLLGSAVYHSVNLWDLIVWAITGTVFLILVYYIFEFLTPKFTIRKEIPNGNVAIAIFSFCLSVASGILMGALISY